MRGLLIAGALALSACFSPNFEGTMCSTQGECPEGFTCGSDNRCHGVGAADADPNAPDAARGADASADARVIDAPAIDAPIDGPIDARPIDAAMVMCSPSTLGAAQVAQSGGICYARYSMRVDWTAAGVQCTSRGGHLVTITDTTAHSAVTSILSNNQPVWIGLFRDGPAPVSFEWVTGEALVFTQWMTGEPNMSNSCVRQGNTGGGALQSWFDDSCTLNFEFVCEFND